MLGTSLEIQFAQLGAVDIAVVGYVHGLERWSVGTKAREKVAAATNFSHGRRPPLSEATVLHSWAAETVCR